jgi:5-methylthioadenosine/S-adenosylhomocysteine deaminase
LCPGFVDTHNHAPYAAFSRWQKPTRYFRARFDWRGKTRCKVVVVPEPDDYYAKNVLQPFKAISQDPKTLFALTLYGQVRGLIGGATTMVVDADLDPNQAPGNVLPGFTRDPSDWPGRVWGVLDVGCVEGQTLQSIVSDLQGNKAKLLVHLGEGFDDFSRGEFMTLVAKGLLTSNTALIHAMALLDDDWEQVRKKRAVVVWSPRSNFRLYGRSIDIGQVLGLGIPVALAPDWTITGSSSVIDELNFVRRKYGWLDPERRLSMVTDGAADVMGMPELGRLQVGAKADLIAFRRPKPVDRADAAHAIITSKLDDLILAFVAGTPIYGDPDLMASIPDKDGITEAITVPVGGGASVGRALRVGKGAAYADSVALLTKQLNSCGLALAPLWEPT